MPTPVALFVYARLDHTRRTVEALAANELAAETDLFVFADGPKREAHTDAVAKVREYIKTIKGFRSVQIREQSKNMGLANSIIAGVSDVVAKYGRVIVVEDDLVTSPFFLRFMNDGLDVYETNADVVMISGYAFPSPIAMPETYFMKGIECWGWATWASGWDVFRADGKILLKELEDKNLLDAFDLNGGYPFSQMLRNQIAGTVDSWAVRWHASAFLANKVSLFPGKTLVVNIGFDGTGTHSGEAEKLKSPLLMRRVDVKQSPVVFDSKIDAQYRRHMKSLTPSLLIRAIRKLKRLFL